MPTAAGLRALLEQTIAPDSGFNVVPIPGHTGYRVGRGLEDSVVLLTPPEVQPDAATNLKRISLAPRILCRVHDGNSVGDIEAGVVEFRPDEPALIDYFLGVSSALIELLGRDPQPGDVSRGMQRLLRLFAQPTRGRGNELGVWGELLVVVTSTDPVAMLDGWHAQVDDRFDFSAEGARLEVKTTTRTERIHQVGLAQLLPVEGCAQQLVSIMTVETDLGTSVAGLVERVRLLLAATPERQMKLLDKVSETLGSDWPQTARHRFDEAGGLASLRVLPANAVPRVDPGPPEVLDVKLTIDVSDVPALTVDDLALAGPLARLVATPGHQ